MTQSTFNKNMNDWYDSLSIGKKMAIWNDYKANGHTDYLEKAYKDYLKTFKLRVA